MIPRIPTLHPGSPLFIPAPHPSFRACRGISRVPQPNFRPHPIAPTCTRFLHGPQEPPPQTCSRDVVVPADPIGNCGAIERGTKRPIRVCLSAFAPPRTGFIYVPPNESLPDKPKTACRNP